MLASELPAWLARAFAFVLGATWGSFFNVAIYRWPREMSVVSPPSHCPACGKPVPGWRNVPILGYLLLRGKAACCGAKMSPRYLFVELLSGVLAVAIAERFIVQADGSAPLGDVGIEALLWFAFAGGLVIATFVDLEWMEIPDEVSIGGTALALATATFRPTVPLDEVVLGAGGGFLVVYLLLVWSWERLTGERGMGEGDAKLMMFIGAFLGWQGALFALVAGSFQGIVGYAIARATGTKIAPSRDHGSEDDLAKAGAPKVASSAPETDHDGPAGAPAADEPAAHGRRRRARDRWRRALALSRAARRDRRLRARPDDDGTKSRKIPFGPFLALGAIEFLFFGNTIVDWYLSLFE